MRHAARRRPPLRAMALVAGTAGLAIALAACTRRPPPQRHTVEIKNFAFRPDTIALAVGDTVVWTNHDIVPHTATETGKGWDSGNIAVDGAWSYVARSPGSQSYYCLFHPSMKATIVAK